ncbi:DNA primase [Bacillus sp. FJAT-47783]|uniref:DNA primase n=1 Tax=Bacillus sp. FJAT-47783 TaxID=2922712 RepID=UPI001FAE59A6|nr:DNA primase [Bacillus sp. FJAT-47783]
MGKRIPDDVVENVQKSSDIVDVVGEYVQLKKQGRNYFGLCPFHGENTPSFSVSPDKQIFHCFGCGAGGNVISFLMQIEGLSFTESVAKLAERTNISLPEEVLSVHDTPVNSNNEADRMIEAYELLKKFYHHLLVNTKEGQHALNYLLSRGLSEELIHKFEIGYSLDNWGFITKFLIKRGFDADLLEKAGIAIKKEDGTFFDRFRNRIMFPIKNHQGKTIAFSGRVLQGDDQPKYLNSPETKIFNKRKILYNFHQARLHIRKNQEAVLFEGFVDVISAVKAGIQHSIATMGTSLTEEHAKIISRNVETAVICYDSDSAGIEATFKAAKILQQSGCHVKVAMMPEGYDPDDYINQFGVEKFSHDVIGASVALMAFKMHYYRRGKNLHDESDRLKYIGEVIKELSLLSNEVEQELYIGQLADEFSISRETLKSQLKQLVSKRKTHNTNRDEPQILQPRTQTRPLLPAFHNAERMLIAHMLRNRDVADRVLHEIGVEFNIEEHRAIATYLYAYYEEGHEPDISHFLSKLPNDQISCVVSDIAMMNISNEFNEQEIKDYISHVSKQKEMTILKEKEAERREAERQKDYVKAAQIAMELIQLKMSK